MLAFLGIVLLIVGLASWAVPKYFFDLEDPPFTVPKKVPFLAGSIGGGLLALSIIFGGLFFSAEAGHVYFVQYNVPIPGLNGKQVVHTDPGYHLRLYGNVMAMKQVLTIKCDSNTKDNGDSRETCNEINVRFNDNVTADVSVAARFRLPTDEAKLKKLFLEYRSEENLINTSLIPQIMSVLRNAARLISAQEYMMGKGGDFEQAVLDQMQNGLYILETETILSHPEEQTVNKERTIERGETIKVIVRKKVDATGNPAHISHSFSEYGVTVTQAAIAHVDPEAKYKETLGKQRDAAAEASVSQQQAKRPSSRSSGSSPKVRRRRLRSRSTKRRLRSRSGSRPRPRSGSRESSRTPRKRSPRSSWRRRSSSFSRSRSTLPRPEPQRPPRQTPKSRRRLVSAPSTRQTTPSMPSCRRG